MSTLQEIQEAVSNLPPDQELKLIAWIHSRHSSDSEVDADLAASVERGTAQLDAGQGVPLDEVRKSTRRWTSK